MWLRPANEFTRLALCKWQRSTNICLVVPYRQMLKANTFPPLCRYDRSNITFAIGGTRAEDMRNALNSPLCMGNCRDRISSRAYQVVIASNDMQMLANRVLCEATDSGRVWVAEEMDRMASSGFLITLMMLHACDYVDMYGVDFRENVDPYHYWDADAGKGASTSYPENRHWFSLEHAVYNHLQTSGLLRIRA